MAIPGQNFQQSGLPAQQSPQQGQQAKFNPALFGISPVLGAASYFAPQGTQDFLGGLKNFAIGTPGRYEQEQNFTPQQQGLQNQSIQQALALLQGGKNQMFQPIADQARQQFNTQTIPGLAERFTSMGDSQRSSAFQGALGQAGAGLEQGLAGLQSQHGLSLLQTLLGAGLQPSFQNNYFPSSQGALQGGANQLAQLLPLLLML